MSGVIFDGVEFARLREIELSRRIRDLRIKPRIGSIVFNEDPASLLYTRLKMEAAVRVGGEFSIQEVGINERVEVLQEKIRIYGEREDLNGVLIQKPAKKTWRERYNSRETGNGLAAKINSVKEDGSGFESWWRSLTGVLAVGRDVDGLTPLNLEMVRQGRWRVLPATVKAVLLILVEACRQLNGEAGLESWRYVDLSREKEGFENEIKNWVKSKRVVVVRRSDIVGLPLKQVLEQAGAEVFNYGVDLDREILRSADIVVSATGVGKLIDGSMLKDGVVAIDVGAPRADIDFDSAVEKAAFITPVAGGVGPVTVQCLMENLVGLTRV